LHILVALLIKHGYGRDMNMLKRVCTKFTTKVFKTGPAFAEGWWDVTVFPLSLSASGEEGLQRWLDDNEDHKVDMETFVAGSPPSSFEDDEEEDEEEEEEAAIAVDNLQRLKRALAAMNKELKAAIQEREDEATHKYLALRKKYDEELVPPSVEGYAANHNRASDEVKESLEQIKTAFAKHQQFAENLLESGREILKLCTEEEDESDGGD
jgi:hypothetical protein